MNNSTLLVRAFSLIELMVVIAIVAVIVAVAAPIYTDYQDRAKITEMRGIANAAIQRWAQLQASDPVALDNGENFDVAGSSIVSSVNINSARVEVHLTEVSGGGLSYIFSPYQQLQYVPFEQNGAITWVCEYTGTDNNSTYSGISESQIVERYFPDCTCIGITGNDC